MELIKKSKQPSKSNAISYVIAGLRGDVRFPKAMFEGEPPTNIPLTANFVAPKPPKEAKVKLTAEQRKALKASQPKPTEAERIAAREARLAKEAANLAARKAKLQEEASM